MQAIKVNQMKVKVVQFKTAYNDIQRSSVARMSMNERQQDILSHIPKHIEKRD